MSARPSILAATIAPKPRRRHRSDQMTVTVDVYASDIVSDIPTETLVSELRDRIANGEDVDSRDLPEDATLANAHTFHEIRMAYHAGNRDRVAELAYRLACEGLGRVV